MLVAVRRGGPEGRLKKKMSMTYSGMEVSLCFFDLLCGEVAIVRGEGIITLSIPRGEEGAGEGMSISFRCLRDSLCSSDLRVC